jgi:hypothetical protein
MWMKPTDFDRWMAIDASSWMRRFLGMDAGYSCLGLDLARVDDLDWKRCSGLNGAYCDWCVEEVTRGLAW